MDDTKDSFLSAIDRKTLDALSNLIENQRQIDNPVYQYLQLTKNNKVLATSSNFLEILKHDNRFDGIRLNTLKNAPEIVENGIARLWQDYDDAAARTYIERVYGISNQNKYNDAFQEFLQTRKYDPLRDTLEKRWDEWDHVHRCEMFLIKWMGAEDTPYMLII